MGSIYRNLSRPASLFPLASHMAPMNFLQGRNLPMLPSIERTAMGTFVWFRRTIGYQGHPLLHSLAHCQQYLGLGLPWYGDHWRPPDMVPADQH